MKEQKNRKIMVNTQKGAAALPLQYKTTQAPKHQVFSNKRKSSDDMLMNLKKELEKYIIMIETEDNVENIETEIRILTLLQIWELITNNNIINNTEWTLQIKNCVEKLMQNGNENVKLKVKTQKVNIESIEISILRAAEQEKSFLDESSESDVFDDDSEYSTTVSKANSVNSLLEVPQPPKIDRSGDIEDLVDRILNGDSSEENESISTIPIDRITSYPIDYYIKSGTFSE